MGRQVGDRLRDVTFAFLRANVSMRTKRERDALERVICYLRSLVRCADSYDGVTHAEALAATLFLDDNDKIWDLPLRLYFDDIPTTLVRLKELVRILEAIANGNCVSNGELLKARQSLDRYREFFAGQMREARR